MAIFMFSLAGVPPTAGFIAKYFVFFAAIVGRQVPLAIIGIVASILGMFYYLRVVWAMYFVDAQEMAATAAAPAPEPALAVVGASANGAQEAASAVVAEPQIAAAQESEVIAAAPVHVPASSAVALVIAVALTLLMVIVASPLDSYAQMAASALLH